MRGLSDAMRPPRDPLPDKAGRDLREAGIELERRKGGEKRGGLSSPGVLWAGMHIHTYSTYSTPFRAMATATSPASQTSHRTFPSCPFLLAPELPRLSDPAWGSGWPGRAITRSSPKACTVSHVCMCACTYIHTYIHTVVSETFLLACPP